MQDLLSLRSDPEEVVTIVRPSTPEKEPDEPGGSAPIFARASDGQHYWVKATNNGQGPKVVVSEYLVGLLGNLIAAPTREGAIVRIPDEVAEWDIPIGAPPEPGLAFGSLQVKDAAFAKRWV